MVAQAHFLGSTLGESHLVLHGEADQSTCKTANIHPPQVFLEDDLGRFDVILNVDSLTEMGEDVARDYWNKIKNTCRTFISINHESNEYSMRDIIKSDKGAFQYKRSLHGLRKGYAEEVVTFGE
jgi:hypothetical protein